MIIWMVAQIPRRYTQRTWNNICFRWRRLLNFQTGGKAGINEFSIYRMMVCEWSFKQWYLLLLPMVSQCVEGRHESKNNKTRAAQWSTRIILFMGSVNERRCLSLARRKPRISPVYHRSWWGHNKILVSYKQMRMEFMVPIRSFQKWHISSDLFTIIWLRYTGTNCLRWWLYMRHNHVLFHLIKFFSYEAHDFEPEIVSQAPTAYISKTKGKVPYHTPYIAKQK